MKRNFSLIPMIIAAFVFILGFRVYAAEKTVGVIMTGDIPYYKAVHKAFLQELTAQGLGPGKVNIILQTPAPDTMAWTNAARKLIAVDSSVIVAYGAPAALAVFREGSSIPLVFAGVYDPGALGITGKNSTGISSKVPVASALKNLSGIMKFSKLGVVFTDSEQDTAGQAGEVKNLEAQVGFQSVKFNIKKSSDAAKISNVDALLITTSCTAMQSVDNIIGVARKGNVATAAIIGGAEEKGIILTLAADSNEQGKEAALMVSKILGGTKASAIPVDFPKKIEMVINIKEASAMGFKVPFDILTSATRVIK